MYLDEHVHTRDEELDYKGTIEEAFEVAKKAGVDAILDIVNSKNPIITKERVEQRLELAHRCNSDVFYGLYLNVTNDPKQIEECVGIYHDFFPKKGDKVGVVGFKDFTVNSAGGLGLSELWEQKQVYEVLSKNHYQGVLAIHCGRQDLMKPGLWDSKNPITHCSARPIEAKVESMRDQIQFALETNFAGKLHFFHVSSPEEANYLSGIMDHIPNDLLSVKVSYEVTPHHLFLFDELMNGPEGLLLKVNPSLRPREDAQGLLKCVKQRTRGVTIGSDHATHSRKEKLEPPYLSGIPGLDLWPRVARRLREEGFSEEQISALTFDNQVKLFGLEDVIQKSDNPGDENLNEYPDLRPQGLLRWI